MSNAKAKGRQHSKKVKYYAAQFVVTERNKARKEAKRKKQLAANANKALIRKDLRLTCNVAKGIPRKGAKTNRQPPAAKIAAQRVKLGKVTTSAFERFFRSDDGKALNIAKTHDQPDLARR